MKRFIAIIIAVFIFAGVAFACKPVDKPRNSVDKLSIVCTAFAQYDWARQILGSDAGNFDISFLQDSGVDMHNYQSTVEDIVKISKCDLFIYVGGESDAWVDSVLKDAANPDMIVISLIDELGEKAAEEEIVEGMEADEGEEEIAYDEHVWLSLKNARIFCAAIYDALLSLNPANEAEYRHNLSLYDEKLAKLDADYEALVDTASVDTLLFGDRFPFRYLTEDYGINYYAAFPGCSAETEASFNTIVFLANKVDELKLSAVMITETADQSIAKTIIDNTQDMNKQVLVLDAMQSITLEDSQSGTTYLSIMESNLDVLREALQ